MNMRRSCMLLILLLFSAAALPAEGDLTMDLSLFNTVVRTSNTDWSYRIAGAGTASFKSSGNRDVKSEVALDIIFPDLPLSALGESIPPAYSALSLALISLDKAYIKVRFPSFRLTAGKSRLSWGDGFVFNSGDILSGSTDTDVDLTTSEVRDETYWLSSVQIPLENFSFLEAVVLPQAGTGELIGIAAGGRVYATIDTIKLESGYLYRGSDQSHTAYVTMQGNFGPDWYAASALTLPSSTDIQELRDGAQESWNLSAGLFTIHQIDRIRTMTLRLESLIRPYASWVEQDTAQASYGLYLYPEIGYTPSDTVSLSLRSIISPIDLSAATTIGGSWNVFQSLSVLGYLTVQAGDANDLFSWEGPQSLALMLGCSFIY
ncbi:MAG: hypothetical protein K9M84_07615 [Spirochaetia bacterium]|nr:hypothetical protein [Spirochaetia bacterium]MCF7941463.1 hypothetical protein [Spirochaetia bacterium]